MTREVPPIVTPWRTPDDVPSLQPDDMHIWRASVREWSGVAAALESVLDSAESARAARFRFAKDREQYSVAHVLMRMLLARYSRIAPADLRFDLGPAGKPCIAPSDQSSYVEFNLAHSGDMVLIAVCSAGPVGVDVEEWTDGLDLDRMSQHFFSSNEAAALRALTPAQRHTAFFRCWVSKEAYIKATGLGISRGLDYFDVAVGTDGPAQLLADRLEAGAIRRWRLLDLEVPGRYSAALVAGCRVANVACLRCDPATIGCAIQHAA